MTECTKILKKKHFQLNLKRMALFQKMYLMTSNFPNVRHALRIKSGLGGEKTRQSRDNRDQNVKQCSINREQISCPVNEKKLKSMCGATIYVFMKHLTELSERV